MNKNNKTTNAPKKAKAAKSKNNSSGNALNQMSSNLSRLEPMRSVPAAMGSVKKGGQPKINRRANGDCQIIHREYISDISETTTFTSKTYAMNPGDPNTFPWLSSVAQRFESYLFKALRFCFETTASSTELGSVMLVPDYDAADSAPVNKTQALSYRGSARAQAWLSFCQESSSEDLNKQKSYFVRNGTQATNTDIRLYDVGNMFVCVQGSNTDLVGELWVEYDVKLMTPQISSVVLSSKIVSGGSGISGTTIFGSAPVTTGNVPISLSAGTITFNQAYQGIIDISLAGTGLAGVSGSGSTATFSVLTDTVATGSALEAATIRVNASAGQTLVITVTSTTVTSSTTRISHYTYSLG